MAALLAAVTLPMIEAVSSVLHRAGSAALAWWRLRDGPLAHTQVVETLRQAFRLQSVEAAVHRRAIAAVFRRFRRHGLEPILAKGWAAARLYPDEAHRLYTDVDVAVSTAEHPAAAALICDEPVECAVDLHCGFPELADRTHDELRRRSVEVALGGEIVRVLGAEDHLRLLALHLLRHGAWRPIWLCDVGVAIEARPSHFDWEYLLWGNPRKTAWVTTVLALANALLDARLEEAPARGRAVRLPGWTTGAVLEAWGWVDEDTPQGARVPMSRHLRSPWGIPGALRKRWPNPLEATMDVGAPIDAFPRWPIQLWACLVRAARFARSFPAATR